MQIIPFKMSRKLLDKVFKLPENATIASISTNEHGSFDFQIAVEGDFETSIFGIGFDNVEGLKNAFHNPAKSS